MEEGDIRAYVNEQTQLVVFFALGVVGAWRMVHVVHVAQAGHVTTKAPKLASRTIHDPDSNYSNTSLRGINTHDLRSPALYAMSGSDRDHSVYSSGYGTASNGAAVRDHESRRAGANGRLPFYLNTRTFTSHIFFGPYIYLPIIAGLTWLGGILALLGLWVRDGKPRYTGTEASVVFISNVAGKHKAVFIPVTAVVSAFWWLALIAERWLRHIDRLPTDKRRREWILVIGGLGLILLAIFDNFNHGRVHWSMTVLFVVFTALSAICQTGEVWSLHKDHPDRRSLLRNSAFKLLIVITAVLGAIAFAALYGVCRGKSVAHKQYSASTCNNVTSGAAAMEWTIAFLLVFYYLSLAGDLWPAGKSSPRYLRRVAKWEAGQAGVTRWRTRAEEMTEKSVARNRGEAAA